MNVKKNMDICFVVAEAPRRVSALRRKKGSFTVEMSSLIRFLKPEKTIETILSRHHLTFRMKCDAFSSICFVFYPS